MKVDGWDAYAGNKNPHLNWSIKKTSAQLEKAFGVGALRSLRVTRRTGIGPVGGRVLAVEAVGSRGKVVISGDQVRAKLGLRSAWFTLVGISTEQAAPIQDR